MSRRLRTLCCSALLIATSTVVVASAADGTGGASGPGDVVLETAVCANGKAWTCGRGQKLNLRGTGMDSIESVVFLGGAGGKDDARAKPVSSTPAVVSVFVPATARSGSLRLHTVSGGRIVTVETLGVVSSAKKSGPDDGSPAGDGRFPIDGRHDMGQSEANSFGGGRGHEGQDMFAACGTPLVAVRDTVVQHVATHAAAGNYVVLQDAAGRSYAYMHMRAPARVEVGDRLGEGDRVGAVGQTGRATGCHLHFELWTAPGWYTGGHAIDPLPQLTRWQKAERR
jgi:hypothetical protein